MKNTIIATALVLMTTTTTHATLVLQPPELNLGDKYRLAFLTSTTRDALSSDITDYNAFVQATADASPLSALGQTWNVIGSTASIDARDNTNTNPLVDGTGEPIYVVDGVKIAVDYADLWDGTILSHIDTTELDGVVCFLCEIVWTGTMDSGVADEVCEVGPCQSVRPLGHSSAVRVGDRKDVTDWVSTGIGVPVSSGLSFYGLSGVITVVPEPTAFILCLEGLLVVGLAARRKRFARLYRVC